jgi:hypothetical protein
MQIFIKLLTEKTKILRVNRDSTIEFVTTLIFESEGIPPRRQRLIYAGKQLEDALQLWQYYITKEAAFDLMLRIGGNSYCLGCALPKLLSLSANVSLQYTDNLKFDETLLLHSIKMKLK